MISRKMRKKTLLAGISVDGGTKENNIKLLTTEKLLADRKLATNSQREDAKEVRLECENLWRCSDKPSTSQKYQKCSFSVINSATSEVALLIYLFHALGSVRFYSVQLQK